MSSAGLAEPVEGFIVAAMIIVYNTGNLDAMSFQPGHIVAGGFNKIHPAQSIHTVVMIAHLTR